ncbi:hypothetical protein SCP_0411630 [Sparassis crispa]|uniref:DUF6697 domain-containing protein n=1 Tax=Sparassis crispa TaxID=139825 RepID=A0A401GKT1_9APHY|nr:hypothetical protein SCP_0411630 [Sparassis crispa]GBE82778.1 hypothetical protein SCP_0411630 [Sparassis crispa]
MSTVIRTLNVSYPGEVLVFWFEKYREVKKELGRLKDAHSHETDVCAEVHNTTQQELTNILKDDTEYSHENPESTALSRSEEHNEGLGQKIAQLEKANEQLTTRLQQCQGTYDILSQQMTAFKEQSATLATEVHHWRMRKLSEMFGEDPRLEINASLSTLSFLDVEMLASALPGDWCHCLLYFHSRRSNDLPLRIPATAKSGYWFHISTLMPDHREFELIMEGQLGEWTYLGRYTSVPFVGCGMTLFEWMNLDEPTKSTHCSRVVTSMPQPQQLQVNYTLQEVRRRYDTGEWRVPCKSLRCTGFDRQTYEMLYAAADKMREQSGSAQAALVLESASNGP